jgi:hypothetical protein
MYKPAVRLALGIVAWELCTCNRDCAFVALDYAIYTPEEAYLRFIVDPPFLKSEFSRIEKGGVYRKIVGSIDDPNRPHILDNAAQSDSGNSRYETSKSQNHYEV